MGELGYSESPANSNKQKYGEWHGLNGFAWCAMFVSWCFDQADIPLGKIDGPKGYAGCQGAYNFFKKKELLTKTPQPGDIVLFDWDGNGKFDHTGIYMSDCYDGINFISIEGNTALGNDSNGGKVMVRLRKYRQAVFVHPAVYTQTT
jgi:hypothetical protein